MSMESRNEYLRNVIRPAYLQAKAQKKKKEQSRLLGEAKKNTGLNRTYLIEKLKPKSSLDAKPEQRRRRGKVYGNEVVPSLAQAWRIFDKSCGQRLKVQIRDNLDNLRCLKEIHCPDEVAEKIKQMGSATIDRRLVSVKKQELAKKPSRSSIHPLLYQEIPVKRFGEQDREQEGFIQLDFVLNCGRSLQGEFVHTLSTADIKHGWWEGEAQMGRGQEPTKDSLEECRERSPVPWKEMHPDNDTAFLNAHVASYCKETDLGFSRSKSYQKNDNCLIEQKNGKVVRQKIGYFRFDTKEELEIIKDLYQSELRLYINFFQPQMKLKEYVIIKGKRHRRYHEPITPYKSILRSSDVSEKTKQELIEIYESLNPADLKRRIDRKLNALYEAYQKKQKGLNGTASKVEFKKDFAQKVFDSTKTASVR